MSKIQWVQHITVSNTLLSPAIYCVTQETVFTFAFKMHLFNFPCRNPAVVSCFALCNLLFVIYCWVFYFQVILKRSHGMLFMQLGVEETGVMGNLSEVFVFLVLVISTNLPQRKNYLRTNFIPTINIQLWIVQRNIYTTELSINQYLNLFIITNYPLQSKTKHFHVETLLCPPNKVWETYCSVSYYYYSYSYYYSSSSFFLLPKVYPTHFSAITEWKSMKHHRNVKHYEQMCRLLSKFSIFNGRRCHGNGQNAKKQKNSKLIIAGYSPNRN